VELRDLDLDEFDDSGIETQPVGPPLGWLVLAALCLMASLALLAVTSLLANLAGYVLASLLALTCVAVFRYLDGFRRGRANYRQQPGLAKVSIALLALCWAVSSIHAWFLATGLAR
jgi:hypothetical protein